MERRRPPPQGHGSALEATGVQRTLLGLAPSSPLVVVVVVFTTSLEVALTLGHSSPPLCSRLCFSHPSGHCHHQQQRTVEQSNRNAPHRRLGCPFLRAWCLLVFGVVLVGPLERAGFVVRETN